MHLKNIYLEGELDEKATTKDFLVVRTEGKRQVKRTLKHYDLNAVISVGYRVNSKRAVQFRQWATARLKEHLVQGFTLNEQRLTQHQVQLKKLEQTLSLFQQNVTVSDCHLMTLMRIFVIKSVMTKPKPPCIAGCSK